MWEEAGHYGGQDFEVALDVASEYDPLILGKWCNDLCTERDFSDSTMSKTRGVVQSEVSHQHAFPLEAVLSTVDDWRIERVGLFEQFSEDSPNLFNVGKNVEEKIRELVLFSLLPHSFESLVTALLVWKRSSWCYYRTKFSDKRTKLRV